MTSTIPTPMDFNTLDDFDVENKTVFVRVDINSPLDPETLAILDTSRIESVIPTLQELYQKKAKIVILAHQGRPGSWDFIPLKNHAEALQRILGVPVCYVDDIFGGKAHKKITELQARDIILLENVRQYAEEMNKKTPGEHAKTDLVTSLAPLGDVFINDAFAAAHRSQCSLVGFTPVLPSGAGRLLEKEIATLTQLMSQPKKPVVFILGGAKYGNVLPVMNAVLSQGIADWVLLAGIPALAFLESQSYMLGEKNIVEKGEIKEKIQKLYRRYKNQIVLPSDFAWEENGKRQEGTLSQISQRYTICDIGEKTITSFREKILNAATIFLSGPMGIFERKIFMQGTRGICQAITDSQGFSIIGGGHTIAALNQLGLSSQVSYISTGGGSLERFIMGEKLPVIEALKASKNLNKPSD